MATIISPANYVKLSDYYADLRANISAQQHYLYDAVYAIVLFDDVEPTLDLLQPFNDTYTQQHNVLGTTAPFHAVARALNNHVLRRGGYVSMDEYFHENSVMVDQNWADICSDAGYTISDTYIL